MAKKTVDLFKEQTGYPEEIEGLITQPKIEICSMNDTARLMDVLIMHAEVIEACDNMIPSR